ncbi:MAG: hypothetical protein JST26_09750 [Bacteroidetes bacterium]|nr:hypothetical protein [Bacteroidota bacterium]
MKRNPILKLAKGILLFGCSYYFMTVIGGADGLNALHNHVQNHFSFLNADLASILGSLANCIGGLVLLYAFVSGLFRICTFNVYMPVFEDKTEGGIPVTGNSSYPNINRVLQYRESLLSSMDNDSALSLMKDTAILDSLSAGCYSGPEALRTLSYAESKLSGMSSDRALNYLSNKL